MDKKNYKNLLLDGRWQMKKNQILQRDDYACQLCGAKAEEGKTLHVHHTYYDGRNPWDYEDDSLITLCDECHKEVHENTYGGYDKVILPGMWLSLGENKYGFVCNVFPDDDEKLKKYALCYAVVDFENFDKEPIFCNYLSHTDFIKICANNGFMNLDSLMEKACQTLEKHKVCYAIGHLFFNTFLTNLEYCLPFDSEQTDLIRYSKLKHAVGWILENDRKAKDLMYTFIFAIERLNYGIFKCLCLESGNIHVGSHDGIMTNLANFLPKEDCEKNQQLSFCKNGGTSFFGARATF